jgi:hypothetical protein
MNGILEQQQAIEAANDRPITIPLSCGDAVVTDGRSGVFIEQLGALVWLPNAAAVDALIEALGEKRKGMK